MCDYSLEAYRTRPAREGERYVTTRFGSGSIGLAAPGDATIPVCVPCDTAMRLQGIPEEVQKRHGLQAIEDVVFIHLDRGAWRDGVRFRNGVTLSLQLLPTGIEVTVTSLLENVARRFEGAIPV
jgi:hypothetical protein